MKENDLRVIKTKNTIQKCFFELLKKKPLDAISVKELCEMAQCSRNTFYVHYQYKENLYKQIVDECIDKISYGFRPLTRHISEHTDSIINRYIINVLESIYHNADTLRLIMNCNDNGFFQARLLERLVEIMVISSEQASGRPANSNEWKLICSYNAGAFVGFFSFLLDHPDISREQAEKILRDLMDSPMHMGEKYLPASAAPFRHKSNTEQHNNR